MQISVVKTLLNAVETIGDCLDSMAAQSHADREHLVMDGGSTDGPLEFLQRRRDQLAVLVSEPDGGSDDGPLEFLQRRRDQLAVLVSEPDGGSDDGTLEFLQRRRDQLAVLVCEPDGGI